MLGAIEIRKDELRLEKTTTQTMKKEIIKKIL